MELACCDVSRHVRVPPRLLHRLGANQCKAEVRHQEACSGCAVQLRRRRRSASEPVLHSRLQQLVAEGSSRADGLSTASRLQPLHSPLTYLFSALLPCCPERSILFCYSRDRAVPLSRLWVKVDPWTQSPTVAVWGVAIAAFCLGLPMLGSVTAFNAILSLSTISLIVIYVTPITARCTWGRNYFRPGPFSLGVWAYPLGAVSTIWMLFSTVVFCLPTTMPVSVENLNYASVAFLGTCTISLAMYFFPVVGAYSWFTGPAHTVDEDSAHALGGVVASKDARMIEHAGPDAQLALNDVEGGWK